MVKAIPNINDEDHFTPLCVHLLHGLNVVFDLVYINSIGQSGISNKTSGNSLDLREGKLFELDYSFIENMEFALNRDQAG